MSTRPWLWASLGFITLGVPVIACGGRVLENGGDGGGAASATSSSGAPTVTPVPGSSGTSTGTPTATATSTPTSSGTATSSGSAFGPFPCTAGTAIYNACPPTASSASPAPGSCQYYVGQDGIDPAMGEVAAPGCVYEWVPPTANDGASCDHIDCICQDGIWQDETPGSGFPCINE